MLAKFLDALSLFIQARDAAVIARRRRPELVRHFVLSPEA
jgi:hypothetical protein